MTSVTNAFLRVHWDREKPLLLAYSGGPDSKALLYALLECGVKPHIAHVDHGWRNESKEEAQSIEKEAENLGCPFFCTRLECEKKGEDEARKKRFSFFSSIFSSHAALLLAHQANDLAETAIKRLFEGAHLAHLGGMDEVSIAFGMPLWRPLLKVKKSEILSFLEERGLPFFIDPSNEDPRYLRARMRLQLFPYLNETFGKQVQDNLALLSERAFELKKFLDRQIEKIPIQTGPWGTLVNLNGYDPIEQRHLLLHLIPTLNRDQLETLLKWINNGGKSKTLNTSSKKIWVDNGTVWIDF